MSTKKVDARGLSCPQPVVLVDRAIADGHTALEILVEHEVARENVSRLLKRRCLEALIRENVSEIMIRTAKT